MHEVRWPLPILQAIAGYNLPEEDEVSIFNQFDEALRNRTDRRDGIITREGFFVSGDDSQDYIYFASVEFYWADGACVVANFRMEVSTP